MKDVVVCSACKREVCVYETIQIKIEGHEWAWCMPCWKNSLDQVDAKAAMSVAKTAFVLALAAVALVLLLVMVLSGII